jgi:hypothetical protein
LESGRQAADWGAGIKRRRTRAIRASRVRFKIRWLEPDGTRIGVSGPIFATKTAATRAAWDMREWWGADATDLKFEVIESINGKVRAK